MMALLRIAGALCLLAGCAPAAETPTAYASTSASSSETLAQVAIDLAVAEDLYEQGETAALAPLVRRLRQQGVRPIDKNEENRVARWEEAVGLPDTPPLRGRVLGPGYSRGKLSPQQDAVLSQTFLSGQKTAISLGERAPGNIRLRLYDKKGRLVCEHTPARGKVCRFTPIFTQRYRIEMHNGGSRDAVYYLAIE